jgi:DNA-binding winged helix-turn-helix (wHTH) protein/tetratricopeptide (TPR) repeat protein
MLPPIASTLMPDTLLRFGRSEVDVAGRALRVDGSRVAIEQRPFELLVHLIRQRHRVVSKQELFEKIWSGRNVTDSSLARAVMKLRQAIGDAGDAPLIRTVPRVGYRFVAPLADAPAQPAAADQPTMLALLPFDNATGDATLDWVGLGLMSMVAETLAQERRLSLVGVQSMLGVATAQGGASVAARAEAVQRDTGAQLVVHARMVRAAAAGYRLDFRIYGQPDVPVGSVVAARPVGLVAGMAQALTDALFRDGSAAAPARVHFLDTLAAEAYARGLQAAAEQRWMPALNLLRMALVLEPGHPAVQLELLRALAPTATDDAEIKMLATELLARAGRYNDACAAAQVHQAVGRFHLHRKTFDLAEFHLQRALELADRQESLDWTALTLMLRTSAALQQSRFADAREHFGQARELCEHSGNRILALAVLNLEACMAHGEGRHERFVQLSCEGARMARTLRAHRYLCDACGNASLGLAEMGRLGEAAAYGAEGFTVALALGDRWSIDAHAANASLISRLAGTPQVSARLLTALEEVQAPVNWLEAVWRARGFHAACSGDAAEAARCFAAALELARAAAVPEQEQDVLPWFIEALILTDRLEEAQAEISQAKRLGDQGYPALLFHLLLLQALLAHRQGRPDSALEFLEQALAEPSAPLWRAWAGADAAWLLAEAGDAAAAGARLAQIDPSLAELPVVLAAQARVLHAAGDFAAAYRTHQRCLSARGALAGNEYIARLNEAYTGHAQGTISAVLPRVPVLPSRL